MKNTILIFFIGFFVAFGGGYLYYKNQTPKEATNETPQPSMETETDSTKPSNDHEPTTVAAEAIIFQDLGCIQCHRVESIGLEGAMTGPDLSTAYNTVESKFGIPIKEFLKKPTSAVMSGVMAGKQLSDEQIEGIIAALKYASEN